MLNTINQPFPIGDKIFRFFGLIVGYCKNVKNIIDYVIEVMYNDYNNVVKCFDIIIVVGGEIYENNNKN
jgi:hypothetical protein